MTDPFVGEIRIMPYPFTTIGWYLCDGTLLPISQHTALFSLLGNRYGGDGRSNFGLPNLNGSVAIGAGQGPGLSSYTQGDTGGVASVTLLQQELWEHYHRFVVSTRPATDRQPPNEMFANGAGVGMYDAATAPPSNFSASALAYTGSSLAHNNMQPYLSLKYAIAWQGVFPRRPDEEATEEQAE